MYTQPGTAEDHIRALLDYIDTTCGPDIALPEPECAVAARRFLAEPGSLKPYTVLLLEPDWLADTFGDTFTAHVMAADPASATGAAVAKAAEFYRLEADDAGREAGSWRTLLICDGHIANLTDG